MKVERVSNFWAMGLRAQRLKIAVERMPKLENDWQRSEWQAGYCWGLDHKGGDIQFWLVCPDEPWTHEELAARIAAESKEDGAAIGEGEG